MYSVAAIHLKTRHYVKQWCAKELFRVTSRFENTDINGLCA